MRLNPRVLIDHGPAELVPGGNAEHPNDFVVRAQVKLPSGRTIVTSCSERDLVASARARNADHWERCDVALVLGATDPTQISEAQR